MTGSSRQLLGRVSDATSTVGKVAIGFCFGQTTITPQWRRSYTFAMARALAKDLLTGEISHEASGVHVPDARSAIVKDFIVDPLQPEWLLFVDTDATFDDDLVERLLASADPVERPIVGGLAFAVRPEAAPGRPGEYLNRFELLPTLTVMHDGGATRLFDYPRDQLVQVHLTGCHCLLIHRSVLEDPRWLEDGHPLPWFRTSVMAGKKVSEDGFFCVKAGSFGYPIFIDTSVKTGHVKTFVADEAYYLTHRFVPPADQRIDVIVPVMRRPQNAEPFMRSLTASTGLADVYAVCDADDADTQAAWLAEGAQVIVSDRGHTFAQKANCAYEQTGNGWLVLVGDDVLFRPGWWDHALHTARVTSAGLVSTNDLLQPAVMNGEHSTHPVISREYVKVSGASWDGPGSLCHEGYRHCFVDNEWSTKARQDGAFAYSPGSVIEHLHPLAGKGERDEVYRKGMSNHDRDQRLWEKRAKEHHAS
jgi:hypothetical protein